MQSVDIDASFVYNENGLRVQKTVNGIVTDYTLHGKNVVHMKMGNDELHFFYDAQNKPAIVVYNGTPYSYVKNLQGDIVAILDVNGAVVVSYVYDAWGRPISKTGSMAAMLGTVQPFRYRGYVYDEETGLYYLQSRYYRPELVRFLSADIYVSTGQGLLDSNIFTYCLNSPVFQHDAVGTRSTVVQTSEADLDPTDDHENYGCGGGGGGGGTQSVAQSIVRSVKNFSSYASFRYHNGKAGFGKHWHHIVEQCQIKLSNIPAELIYSTQNTLALDASVHQLISNFYSSIKPFTNGLTVRSWLSGKPFDEQYAWGLKFLDQIIRGD